MKRVIFLSLGCVTKWKSLLLNDGRRVLWGETEETRRRFSPFTLIRRAKKLIISEATPQDWWWMFLIISRHRISWHNWLCHQQTQRAIKACSKTTTRRTDWKYFLDAPHLSHFYDCIKKKEPPRMISPIQIYARRHSHLFFQPLYLHRRLFARIPYSGTNANLFEGIKAR